MQFYLKDWLADTRILNPAERGIWIDALAYMWRSPRRGYLLMPNGCKPDAEAMRNMFGTQNGEAEQHLARIVATGVAEIESVSGVIYNRRMAREAHDEAQKSEAGRKAAEARWNAERMQNDGSPTPVSYSGLRSPDSVLRENKTLPPADAAGDVSDGKTDSKADRKPDPKPRERTPQQVAVDVMLSRYAEGYLEVTGNDYPGITEKYGRVMKWLKSQPVREGAVLLWQGAVEIAVQAHKLDQQFHKFPMTIPAFCEKMPLLNQTWLDGAKRNGQSKPRKGYEVRSKYDD